MSSGTRRDPIEGSHRAHLLQQGGKGQRSKPIGGLGIGKCLIHDCGDQPGRRIDPGSRPGATTPPENTLWPPTRALILYLETYAKTIALAWPYTF